MQRKEALKLRSMPSLSVVRQFRHGERLEVCRRVVLLFDQAVGSLRNRTGVAFVE
jgi:hypothetical protein